MRYWLITVLAILMMTGVGCSGSSNSPVLPDDTTINSPKATEMSSASRHSWGVWDITIDPVNGTVEIIPLRGAMLTVNVVQFMQPPIGSNNILVSITDLADYFTDGSIVVDVTLLHPFIGLDQYTGFDVYGVFIHEGNTAFPYNGETVVLSDGIDNGILENADGYTCWFSPGLFPEDGSIFTFMEGALGDTGFPGVNGADANAYKYFCDGLANDESVKGFFIDSAATDNRGKFSPGSANTREYQLKFPMVSDSPVLNFQYAVVASWEQPDQALSGDPDTLDIPGDFPLSANAMESFFVDITDNSTTWYQDQFTFGGDISLDIEVFDWDGVDGIGNIYLVSSGAIVPGGFQVFDPGSLTWTEGTAVSSITTLEVSAPELNNTEGQEVLLVIESASPTTYDQGFGTAFPEIPLAGYFRHTLNVASEPGGGDVTAMGEAEIEMYFDGFGPEGTTDDPIPTEWYLTLDASASTGTIVDYLWEVNGDGLYDDASGMIVSAGFPDSGTHSISLKVTNGSGGESTFDLPGTYEVVNGTYVDGAYTGGTPDGSRDLPFPGILAAVAVAGADGYILARGDNGSGGHNTYSENLLLTTTSNGLRIQGYNGDSGSNLHAIHTGWIKILGDDMIIDGFEVTGSAQTSYQPYNWNSKLGVQNGQDNLFRHIYMHNVGPASGGDGFVCWAGATMTVENCLLVDLNIGSLIVNRTHNSFAHTDLINCTFDRLGSTSTYGWYNSGTGTSDALNCLWTDIGSGGFTKYLSRDGAGEWYLTYNNVNDTAVSPNGGVYYAYTDGVPYTPDPGTGCIELDPLYVDPYTDHHLDTGSPCIDAGDPAIFDADGSTSDIGCYGGPNGDWDFEN